MLVDPDTGRPRKFAYTPGLVVVDGGPPQVAAAQRALDELGIDDVPLCGLAKRLEEVWVPGEPDPVILPAVERGPLPAPAHPRRGPPLRDHPPPVAALEDDGGEPARRRPRARRGAPQDTDQAFRVTQEAPGCHHRGDRRGARDRHPDRHGDRGGGGGLAEADLRQHRDRRDPGATARSVDGPRRAAWASSSSSPG